MDDSYISKQELTWLGSVLDTEADCEIWREFGFLGSVNRARRIGFTLRCWWNEVTGKIGPEIQNFALLMFMSNCQALVFYVCYYVFYSNFEPSVWVNICNLKNAEQFSKDLRKTFLYGKIEAAILRASCTLEQPGKFKNVWTSSVA